MLTSCVSFSSRSPLSQRCQICNLFILHFYLTCLPCGLNCLTYRRLFLHCPQTSLIFISRFFIICDATTWTQIVCYSAMKIFGICWIWSKLQMFSHCSTKPLVAFIISNTTIFPIRLLSSSSSGMNSNYSFHLIFGCSLFCLNWESINSCLTIKPLLRLNPEHQSF